MSVKNCLKHSRQHLNKLDIRLIKKFGKAFDNLIKLSTCSTSCATFAVNMLRHFVSLIDKNLKKQLFAKRLKK
jgi:hypothetical protein